jgi:hypothetical protein
MLQTVTTTVVPAGPPSLSFAAESAAHETAELPPHGGR